MLLARLLHKNPKNTLVAITQTFSCNSYLHLVSFLPKNIHHVFRTNSQHISLKVFTMNTLLNCHPQTPFLHVILMAL